MGDLDGGGGKPDILVGAPKYGETIDTNEFACSASCPDVGKVFMFRGEDITGSGLTDLVTRADQTMSYFEPVGATTPRFGAGLRARRHRKLHRGRHRQRQVLRAVRQRIVGSRRRARRACLLLPA